MQRYNTVINTHGVRHDMRTCKARYAHSDKTTTFRPGNPAYRNNDHAHPAANRR